MARRTPEERSRDARAASLHSWANTADANVRLRNAHENSPSGYSWHARRLYGKDVDLDVLTTQQWERVTAARLAYLRANAIKAGRARARMRAQELREKAEAIDAAVDAEEAAGVAADAS